jgi:hypothetical protein
VDTSTVYIKCTGRYIRSYYFVQISELEDAYVSLKSHGRFLESGRCLKHFSSVSVSVSSPISHARCSAELFCISLH